MARKPLDEELLEDSHIFLHPVRYRLLELLEGQPLHPNALSSTLGMERRLLAYHLAKLEDRGFVTSRYVISELDKSKGKALKVYTVTDKAADVRAKLKEEL